MFLPHCQLLAGLQKAHSDGAAALAREAAIGPGVVCEVGSRNEGFFSNFLQAVDALLACAARGAAGARIVWGGADFPYADGGGGNAWEQFFEPVKRVWTPAAYEAARTTRVVDYSRDPAQVPTQFERYHNARLDNLHRPAMTPADRLRVHRAMLRLGVVPRQAMLQRVATCASLAPTAALPTQRAGLRSAAAHGQVRCGALRAAVAAAGAATAAGRRALPRHRPLGRAARRQPDPDGPLPAHHPGSQQAARGRPASIVW